MHDISSYEFLIGSERARDLEKRIEWRPVWATRRPVGKLEANSCLNWSLPIAVSGLYSRGGKSYSWGKRENVNVKAFPFTGSVVTVWLWSREPNGRCTCKFCA
jgi:hypothetical protein